jgi:HEAT repeat protein
MSCMRVWGSLVLLGTIAGCGVGPRHFRALSDPSPLARARAAGLGEKLPDDVVVPALIERLQDQDPVVRLSSNEALKRRTGQDMGFVAWSEPDARAQAVGRWRAWWKGRQPALANSGRIP